MQTQLMAMRGLLADVPHDPAVRRLVAALFDGACTVNHGRACNLACTYCSQSEEGPLIEPEERLRALATAIDALGYRRVAHLGGEPTIHPRFLETVGFISSLRFQAQVLVTNGLKLADRDFLEQALAAGINAVNVSLDVFDRETQEELFGGHAGYESVLAGLRNVLPHRELEVVLSTVVNAPTAGRLESYVETVADLQQTHQRPIGVLMLAMQRPWPSHAPPASLALDMAESSRLVRGALARAGALGITAFTCGYPRCLLDEHDRHALELYASEWLLDLETGTVTPSRLQGATTFWGACVECRYAATCNGVFSDYATPELGVIVTERARQLTA